MCIRDRFESIDQVFYDQANDRLYNCESGFFFRNPADSGQQMYAVSGTVYPLALPESWHFGKANAQGQRSFGDNGGNLCPTLVSNPVEGLLTVYGYNEVGDPNCFGIPNYWCGALPDGNFYRFDGPGNLAIMDPGVPYGRYYYTRGSDIFDIQQFGDASEADILTLLVNEKKGNTVFDELYGFLKLSTQKNGVIYKSDTIAKSSVK